MKKLLCLIALLPTLAFAQVELKTEIFKVVETRLTTGKVKQDWVKDQAIAPGDKVGYQILFTNSGAEPADNIVLNNPIPEHTFYIADSARGANSNIVFSADGGKLFATPEKLFIEKDGKKVLASPKEYTNVRWSISKALPAGESGSVQYIVEVK